MWVDDSVSSDGHPSFILSVSEQTAGVPPPQDWWGTTRTHVLEPLFTLVPLITFNFLCPTHSLINSFIQIGSQSAVSASKELALQTRLALNLQ